MKKGKQLEYEDDLCIMYKDGKEINKDIFDYMFDDHDEFYNLFRWDDKTKSYKYNNYNLVVIK